MSCFIQNDLEIQCLILYVLSRLEDPISMNCLQYLVLIDDGINYFTFADNLNELEKTLHVEKIGELYELTEKGKKNSKICEDSIPKSVRTKADDSITAYKEEKRRESLVCGNVTESTSGSKYLHLYFKDEVDSILSLKVLVPEIKKYKEFSHKFESNPTKFYQELLTFINNFEGDN